MREPCYRAILWAICLGCLPPSFVIAAAPATAADAESEFRELVGLLAGRYSGETADPADPAAQRRTGLHHKIVRVELPNFGEHVYSHQISRDAPDSAQPWQQKLYVFDRDPARPRNSMRAFVVPPAAGLANFEADPPRLERVAALSSPAAGGFEGFPPACDIVWSREPDGAFVGRVRREACRYESRGFAQPIAAELTYRVTRDAFGIEEALYDASGQPLFPPRGLLTVARRPATVAEVLAVAAASDWRRPDPERTLYLDLDAGRVVFELSPVFAPAHVANLRVLARSGWFDGLSINRVQDNFVAQWGDADGGRPIINAATRLAPEFERGWTAELRYTPLPDGDVFAPDAGFVDDFPVAGDRRAGRIWMAHCYGTLGVGRDLASDSGNAAELFAVIGHAPRQLDRNITVLGRALTGIELLAALPRGTAALGFYATPAERTPIRRLRFAADLPAVERTDLEVLRTDSATFAAVVEARRNRRDDWYKVPAGRIDLCSVPLPVRRVAP